MEEKQTKYLEHLSKKVLGKETIERPSFNFTDTVMSQVNALEKSTVTVYKPLISKKSWVLIGFGVLGLVLYIFFFGSDTETTSWMQSIDLNVLQNINMDIMPSLSLSKTFTYAIMLLGLMICIQIPLLKNHFNKRFET
ncbi:hypothetical protein DIS18_11545 [Algibacter marinivivus]|uniref:Uncharacterized protein n=1 Tax=Algibacter marinivivus TaxID=2100723 RepID=A0A2U2X4Z2_9FLAO|nr:hypothetical protein [Algibacter marinivivus]PWH82855.1 hypothetical protein DIS18_11545 [Algibacter marinivivus]